MLILSWVQLFLQGPLWPTVMMPVRVASLCQNLCSEIIGLGLEYLKPYKYARINDYYQIELLILDRNIWNQITVCK